MNNSYFLIEYSLFANTVIVIRFLCSCNRLNRHVSLVYLAFFLTWPLKILIMDIKIQLINLTTPLTLRLGRVVLVAAMHCIRAGTLHYKK
jgi:uncharacterized membrane protein